MTESNGNTVNKREKWISNVEYLMTCLSFVIGFGNIWRFPYICYTNGGIIFLIPYFLSLLFIGLPLLLIEMTLGQYSAKGLVMVWSFMPLFQGIGVSMFLIVLIQSIYYNVLIAWSLFYFFSSFTLQDLPWSDCGHTWNTKHCTNRTLNETDRTPSDEYFHEYVLHINTDMKDISTLNFKSVLCLFIAWILVFAIVSNGIKSIGKVSYLTTIFPYICLTILLIRGILLKGGIDGIIFYMTPNWSKLFEMSVWVEATQQIFFSLSVSFGIIITLSSYNRFDNYLLRDSLIITFGNSFTSIFAGFVIFSYLGSLAYERKINISEVAVQGPGLTFIVYPEAVTKFPFGQVFSILFFFMLTLLGLGSETSLIQSIISTIFEYKPTKSKYYVIILALISYLCFLFGLIFCSNAGMYWFDLVNSYCASTSAMIVGLFESVAISWVYGIDKFMEHINEMCGHFPKPRLYWKIVFKYITPIALFVLIILSIIDIFKSNPSYRDYQYPMFSILLIWFVNFLVLLPIPAVIVYHLYECFMYEDCNMFIKEVSNPNIDWKSKNN